MNLSSLSLSLQQLLMILLIYERTRVTLSSYLSRIECVFRCVQTGSSKSLVNRRSIRWVSRIASLSMKSLTSCKHKKGLNTSSSLRSSAFLYSSYIKRYLMVAVMVDQ